MKFFMDHMASPEWAVRRRIIILVLLWGAGLITYLAILGREVSLSETIATNVILLMGSVIGSYVFGAVWETNVKRKTDVAQTAVDQGGADTKVEVLP